MSEPSEYICISCWTPFQGVPDKKGELTCPHCGFAQPAGDDQLPSATDPGDAGDMTMQDMRAPWLDEKKSKDPISFGNLDQLEQLLGNSGQSAPAVKSTKSASPKVKAATTGAPPPPPAAPAESSSALEAITADSGPSIWRLKSDSGMTYSFLSVPALIRWADGLGPQEKASLTPDGAEWKPLADFRNELGKNSDPVAAFEATPVPEVVVPEPSTASTTGSGARPLKPKSSVTQNRRRPTRATSVAPRAAQPSTTGERKRTASMAGVSSEMEELMKAASASEGGGGGTAPSISRRSTGTGMAAVRNSPKSSAGAAQAAPAGSSAGTKAALVALGAILGGAGVYFGMYLLGFYDLVFTL